MKILLAEMSWPEVKERLQPNALAVVPVAATEQHGPHLPVMTDTRLGHEVAVRAARIAWPTRPTVVTPVVWSGLSEHHMAFGGTLILSHATFRAVLHDLIHALARHGFRDVLISNSHGGNIVAMQQIADELGIQERTVKAHMSAIFEKLGVRNRTQASIVFRDLEI